MEDTLASEKQAWDEYNELCMLVKNDIRSVLRKGEILKSLRDTDRYKKLGDGGYETFNSFLSDPILKISRSYAFQHIQLFDFYIVDLRLPIEEIEKIASIKLMRDCMTFITKNNLTDEEALDVIDKAKVLSYRDFFSEVEGIDLPKTPELIEGEVEQPTSVSEVIHDISPLESYQRPTVKRCENCHKARVEYTKEQICGCDGKLHIDDVEGGDDDGE